MIARAITARCFCPPERSDGYLSMNCSAGASPTVSSASATRRRRSAPSAIPWISSGCPTDCSIVIAGLSEACGSWKTICIRRRRRRSSRSDIAVISSPSNRDTALGRRDEPQKRAAQRRLAASGLADEPEDLAATDVERDVVDRAHASGLATEEPLAKAATEAVVRLQVPDRDEDVVGGCIGTRFAVAELRLPRRPRAPRARAALDRRPSRSSGVCNQQKTRRPLVEVLLRREPRGAHLHRVGTPRMEATPGRRLDEVRRRSRDRVELGRVERDRRAQQLARVRMSGLDEDVSGISLLDDLSRVHHGDAIAGLGDDPEVVRDEEERRAEVPAQVGEDAQDLRLDDDVERRRRLVGDQELWPQDERERDHDPLAHAARELVRVLVEPRRRDPHLPERLERPAADLLTLQTAARAASASPRSAARCA